ncbi:hypothetical protein TNCV_1272411 [Trichonephila clavipes]|nr:hypothetical protein TNCV_1272411 [Trichonephila clavipes]
MILLRSSLERNEAHTEGQPPARAQLANALRLPWIEVYAAIKRRYLLYCHPNIYKYELTKGVKELLDKTAQSLFTAKPLFIKKPPYVEEFKFHSLAGEEFVGYAKDELEESVELMILNTIKNNKLPDPEADLQPHTRAPPSPCFSMEIEGEELLFHINSLDKIPHFFVYKLHCWTIAKDGSQIAIITLSEILVDKNIVATLFRH